MKAPAVRIAAGASCWSLVSPLARAGAGPPRPGRRNARRCCRYSFPAGETGSTRRAISDLYSRTVTAHIFDGLYHYDQLARPVVWCKPNTADGMPQHLGGLPHLDGAHQARHLLRRRPGLQGQEARAGRAGLRLFVEALLRPGQTKSPLYSSFNELGMLGVDELRDQAIKDKAKPFDYDREVEGCARSTATRCSSSSTSRGRASSTRWPLGDLFGGRARGGFEHYPGQDPWSTRWAPGRSSSCSGGAVR